MPDDPAKHDAEVVRDEAAALIQIAKDAKLDMVAYLLEMAVAEADDIVKQLDRPSHQG